MDLAQATGVAETIDLAGEPRQVRLLTLKEWGAVSAWLKRASPSPVTRAMISIQQMRDAGEPMDQATRDEALDHAQRAALAWPPRIGSQEWFDAIERVDGGLARLLFEVVSRVDPTFTVEMAEALAPRVRSEEWTDLVRVCYHGVHPRPKKAEAPTDGASESPPSPPSRTNGAPSSGASSPSTASTPSGSAT